MALLPIIIRTYLIRSKVTSSTKVILSFLKVEFKQVYQIHQSNPYPSMSTY